MYNEILYPTDGSEGAKAALHSVRDLAATYEATVHILYVAKQPEIHGLASDTEVDSAGGMVGDPTGGGPGMRGDRTKDDEVKKRAEEQGRHSSSRLQNSSRESRHDPSWSGANPTRASSTTPTSTISTSL